MLMEKKAEILGRRNKELELLKMDSLEGLIKKALVEKEKYETQPCYFFYLFICLFVYCFVLFVLNFYSTEKLMS